VLDLCRHAYFFGDLWLKNKAIFWRLCIHWYPKMRQIIDLLFVLQIKKTNTQIENGHFVVPIHIPGQQKHLFYKMNTQMGHFREGPLLCNV
jgi:hypothetical protein